MVEAEREQSTVLPFCVWIVLLLIDHVCLYEEDFVAAAVQRCMLMNYGTGRGSQFDDLLNRFVSSFHDDACSFDVPPYWLIYCLRSVLVICSCLQ